jgi:hypothetical protein
MIGAGRSRLPPPASCFSQLVLKDVGDLTQQLDWLKVATYEAPSAIASLEEAKHHAVVSLISVGPQRQVRDRILTLKISENCMNRLG